MATTARSTRGSGQTGGGERRSKSSHRLAAYEQIDRPVRSRTSRTSFAASTNHQQPASSDVSSSLVSPTHVIHAIPRPKSPREPRHRPNYSAAKMKQASARQSSSSDHKSRSRSAPMRGRAKTPIPKRQHTILAAQHFQSAVVKIPLDFENKNTEPTTSSASAARLPRRLPQPRREPSWKTTDVTISGDSTTSATTPSSASSPPRRNNPRRSPSPPRTTRPRSASEGRPQRAAVRSSEPDSLLRGCIQGGIQGTALLGSKFAECLYLSADIYQQECGPHQQRGGDRMFLYRRRNESEEEEDDIVEDDPSSFYSGSRSKGGASSRQSRSRTKTDTASAWSRSRSDSPEESDAETDSKPPSTPYRSNRRVDLAPDDEDEEKTPTRRTYRRHHDSFDITVNPHSIRFDQGEMPRLHAASRQKTPWEQSLPDATNEFVELRNLRLSMFQHDSTSSPQGNAKRAVPFQQPLQSINDKAVPPLQKTGSADSTPFIPEPAEIRRRVKPPEIKAASPPQGEGPSFPPWRRAPPPASNDANDPLRKELEETKQSLQRARDELMHAQELAVRQQADVQTRTTQLAEEKLQAEAKLQEEARAKEELLKRISKLQEETTQLKSTLRSAQRESAVSPGRRPPRSPSLSFDSRSSTRGTPPQSPGKRKEPLNTKSTSNRGVQSVSPDRALADDMIDEASPTSSRDDEDVHEHAARRAYDSGAVLNLVREVVRSSKGGSKASSPVSVMDVDQEKTDKDMDQEEQVSTPPRDQNTEQDDGGSPYLSSRLISLRSELLDMRSQLAEADAARIKAETRRDEVEKLNSEIQRETRKLREEVDELKQLVLHMRLKEGETHEKYENQVKVINLELARAKERAEKEERLKERLEEELTGTQNEADDLRGQVARFMKELERTKTESEEKVRVSDAEAKNLQEELRLMKLRLSQTNAEIVEQAAEHLKQRQEIESELEQSRGTAAALRKRVLVMDDQLTSAENETEHLRHRLASSEDRNYGGGLSPTSSWKKSFAGMAESITRTLSDGGGDGPIIIPEAPPKDARSSVMERLRYTLDPNHSKSP